MSYDDILPQQADIEDIVNKDFNKARTTAGIKQILNIFSPKKGSLLPLNEVKGLIKQNTEIYQGLKEVPIKQIVGSEGRYKDFTKEFLPKKESIRKRWATLDKILLKKASLPPVKLYKIGDVYFVRDGNHRVSVAASKQMYSIDAEVIEMTTNIKLKPNYTIDDLKKKIIKYEEEEFYKKTGLAQIIPKEEFVFTATGRFNELYKIIKSRKHYILNKQKKDLTLKEAAESWYLNWYKPVIIVIDEKNMLKRFPGRTKADLYIWIRKHWKYLKKTNNKSYKIRDAAKHLNKLRGKNLFKRIFYIFNKTK